jgi:hypothetical protein
VEGQAEHLHVEVNGVAGQVAFGPAPVAVFDEEAGKGGQNEIARRAGDQFQTALLEQGRQRRQVLRTLLSSYKLHDWRRKKPENLAGAVVKASQKLENCRIEALKKLIRRCQIPIVVLY